MRVKSYLMTLLMEFEYIITRSQTVTEPTTTMPSGSMRNSDGPPKIYYIFHLEGGSEKNDPLISNFGTSCDASG